MNLIFELFLRGLIVDFLGRYTRYYFFKAIGKPKTMDYLTAGKSKDHYFIISQHMSNVIIGLLVTCGLFFGIAYLGFTYLHWN